MIIGHGGNKQDLAGALGCDIDQIIDMSSNLNPLGPPKGIEKFICDNIAKIRSLPLPDAAGMRKGFARFHNIDESRVVPGNGTTWFIYTIPKALGAKRVLITGPTYSDYQDACIMHGVEYTYHFAKAENNFIPDLDEVSSLAQKADIVFICNPNNPTGALVEKQRIESLLQAHKDTLFVLDESYLPFVENAEEFSFIQDTGYKNVLVLSSMSKIFRIPGLRTGFLIAEPSIVEKIMDYYQPWSINSLAQAVIEHIFKFPEKIEPFYRETRDYIQKEKNYFYNGLKDAKGIHLIDSSTYFILACLTEGQDAKTFCEKIGQHKILIRNCSNFQGLSEQSVRFSLRKREENHQLLTCIKQALQNG